MGALRFKVISERLFTCLISPAMWGKVGVEFISSNGWKVNGEAVPMVVLVMDRVRDRNLGMVTTFCHHNQAKVEACEALSVLHQHDSPEPSMIVVRRFTNSPYLLWGSFGFLYLDVTTFSGGTSSSQFPLDQLCACRLLTCSNTEVVLPWEEGQEGLKVYPFFQETLLKSSEEDHGLSDPILLLVPSSPPSLLRRGLPDWGRTWHPPSSKVVARHQPGQNLTWMGVSPWSRGVD